MPPVVKGFAAVVKEDHGIDTAVNYEKRDEKETRSAHCEFLAYGRSEKMFPGHKAIVVEKIGVAKIRHRFAIC
jgi:hypothetical protein